MINLCTGHYMNYYDSTLGGKDLFIIINEGNGEATTPLDIEKLHKAEEICEKYINEEHIDKDARKKLQNKLEDVFEYGVQIYIANEFEQMKQ